LTATASNLNATEKERDSGTVQEDLGAVKETTEVLSGKELVSDEFLGSWPMFGNDTRMKIGGYVKADFVIDLDGTLEKTQFLMRTIPVEGTPDYGNDAYVAMFSKESRFNIDVRRVRPGALPLRGFIEGDFFTAGNQFRLRHAYVSAGDFLIGQTWTMLTFLESLPFIIDFGAGDALFGGRTTQIRYTRTVNDRWKVAVGLENLDYLGIENPNDAPGRATTQMPLIAARADRRWETGVLFLGTSVAQLHWDGAWSDPSASAVQFDLVVAGRQKVGSPNYVTWNVAWGVGAGENIMAFADSDANAVLDANSNLDTMPALSAVLGCGREWSPRWSSNLALAYGWLDTPDSRAPYALKRGGIGHINLIFEPRDNFSTGIEFMYGAQRVQNNAKGDASRVQYMVKYAF